MPNLKHLLDELKDMRIDPDEIYLTGVEYDEFIQQAVCCRMK